MLRGLLPLLLLAFPLLQGCALFADETREPKTPLPAGWDTVEPFAFEQLLVRSFPPADPRAPAPPVDDSDAPMAGPGTGIVRFDKPSYAALEQALDRMDLTSVRAALLLAHSRHRLSGKRLMYRLEQRRVGPERISDAGDVVAAAAMASFPEPERWLPRLRELAVGRRPHPDLDVRVECAVSVLALGDDSPIDFLLKVLRIDTYAGAMDERDFEVSETTAWPRGRAAEALSRRAGVPLVYQPDGSIADREREAERLERLLSAATVASAPISAHGKP